MNEEQLRAELKAVYGSVSWKITAPLRLLGKTFSMLKNGGLNLRSLLVRTARYIARQPRIKQLGMKLLNYFPGVKRRLKRVLLANHAPAISTADPKFVVKSSRQGPPSLSPKARLILSQLQAEMSRFK
ncbi:hypothetical protein [Undibacterium sp. TS12]|uniref:hypothetical protein n=1 Tax=Undibacterium sp. TS12 TaxID=2908202 RepID=UPI001F4C8D5E|nr:hypothetical protein [Undibacterium sp. TS12]MCH8621912.1 hypothetical protein [Undibacterium sp. TS12]